MEAKMSCDNKPPMTVWLAFDAVDCFDRNEDCGASDLKNHHHHIGPYVNLEQFKSDLIKRAEQLAIDAAEAAECDLPYPLDDCVNYWLLDAYDELAKEIEDGKG
jgi:hypothetical protein